MALITAFNNRDNTVTITICNVDGSLTTLSTGDFLRCKIGKDQNTPVLDILSGVATANGSNFPTTNPFELTLVRSDVALLNRGIWTLEVSLYDLSAGASGHFYYAQEFQLEVRGTQGGDIV